MTDDAVQEVESRDRSQSGNHGTAFRL